MEEVFMSLSFVSLALGAVGLGLAAAGSAAAPAPATSMFDIKATALDGKPLDLGTYRGQVVLVVNVASKCGFTPQYAGLEKLHEELSPKGVVVLGVPSNEFGNQEPGSPDEIATFCKKNYGVTFQMLSKSVVKPGPEQSPLYAFLTAGGDVPSWNFCKYVVGKDGKVKAFFPSKVTPEDATLRQTLMDALKSS
jgi:glutathione peroxidase